MVLQIEDYVTLSSGLQCHGGYEIVYDILQGAPPPPWRSRYLVLLSSGGLVSTGRRQIVECCAVIFDEYGLRLRLQHFQKPSSL